MSREIKFRAWHNKHNEYLIGSVASMFRWLEEGQDIAIEQYTGLKDKNGVEIYEGDIVNGGFDNCEVKYSEDRAQFVIDSFAGEINLFKDKIDKCGVIVIGNIHQDPELLG